MANLSGMLVKNVGEMTDVLERQSYVAGWVSSHLGEDTSTKNGNAIKALSKEANCSVADLIKVFEMLGGDRRDLKASKKSGKISLNNVAVAIVTRWGADLKRPHPCAWCGLADGAPPCESCPLNYNRCAHHLCVLKGTWNVNALVRTRTTPPLAVVHSMSL